MIAAPIASRAGLRSTAYADLSGWADADFATAWTVFRPQALHVVTAQSEQRVAARASAAFRRVCDRAARLAERLSQSEARQFFEQAFEPVRIMPANGDDGFVTGYYEPVVEGSLTRSAAFQAPLLPRPDDLVTLSQGEQPQGVPAGHSAGRLGASGLLESYPDRAALEAFAVTPAATPLVWLRDWTEVYLIHVQGSARVKLADGSEHRLTYAGRNGHPYTSIGRILIETDRISQGDMSLDVLKDWLRDHGQGTGQEARALMQANRSYIFFRMDPIGAVDHGPIGGAGLPLTALHSIAVDRALWSYGLPFWIESSTPLPGFGPDPLARLFIAQDTGSAIVGPARADLFLGSGDAAGAFAGAIRHPATFTALLPRSP